MRQFSNKSLILLAYDEGGLGNRLVLFSKIIAFAHAHGLPLANASFAEYASSFDSTSAHSFLYHLPDPDLINAPPVKFFTDAFRDFMMYRIRPEDVGSELAQKLIKLTPASLDQDTTPLIRNLIQLFGTYVVENFIHKLVALPEVELFDTKRGVFNLESEEFLAACDQGKLIILNGWDFFANDSYAASQAYLRQFFKPAKEHAVNIQATLDKARRPGTALIGVHVRRGDYKEFQGGKFYFELSTYSRIMHEIQRQFVANKVSFFVTSNEALSQSDFPGLTVTFGTGVPIEDLYTLAGCDYACGPPSTFSGWASFMTSQSRFDITSADMPAPPLPAGMNGRAS